MIIVMKLNATAEEIDQVKTKVSNLGCIPHLISGTKKLVIGVTGPTVKIKNDDFLLMPSVEDVVPIMKKYKLVSRQMKEEDTVINIRGSEIGGKKLTIIAGPCSVESKEQMFIITEKLKDLGIEFIRAGAYKPRSSPYSFQGLKEEGLKILDEVRKEFDVKIVTEVLNPRNIEAVSQAADVFQIGARNMQNFALLEEIGKTGKPILLKRGLSATVEDLLLSAEYILNADNPNIILCERGIRTFETSTRNTLDLNAVPVVKKNSHLPIIVDPSHGIGIGDKVPAMALAAIAAGADGLIIEVHHQPENAISDGFQSLTPRAFAKLLEKIKLLAPIVDRDF